MKMRKLLPLVLLAVGALFLLTSCDAMLDAIFQTDVINLDVRVLTDPGHADFNLYGSYVNVILYDSIGNVISNVNESLGNWDGIYAHHYFTFNKLKDGTYVLWAQYLGALTGPHLTTDNIYDNAGFFVGTFITLPDASLGDSTGHTVNISMYAP